MPETKAEGQARRLFVGVGIDRYDHFRALEQAVAEAKTIGALLARHRGYESVAIVEVTDAEAERQLKAALPKGALAGGALILLWAGHGEISKEGQLRLITQDAEKDDTPTRTAVQVAGWAGRTGARQILLLFDTCYSGGGVLSVAEVLDRLMAESPEPKPSWVGVAASSQEYERARDGAFFAELQRLLVEGPRTPELRMRFSPFNKGVSGLDILLALTKEWSVSAHKPLQLNLGDPEMMFPNPCLNPEAPERDVEHLLVAARGCSPEEDGFFFTGRAGPLEVIVNWLARNQPGALVVTGPPGCGKSALAGRIVALAHPAERQRLIDAGETLGPDPGTGTVHAYLHVRRLTVERVAEQLDRQLRAHGLLREQDQPRSCHELMGALLCLQTLVTIVVDGLDEAEDETWKIADELLAPLARVARLLVATRECAREGRSLVSSLSTVRPLDLGEARWTDPTLDDVRAYVRKRLHNRAPSMDPGAVANSLVALPGAAEEGLFLLARVITTQLRANPIDTRDPGWRDQLAASVGEALDRDIQRIDSAPPSGGDGPRAARELLTALTWGYGRGLPDDIWATVATALSCRGAVYTAHDVYWILTAMGRHIVAASGGDRAVYRLSHRRLAEHLRPPQPLVERLEHNTAAVSVATAVTRHYRRLLRGGMRAEDHRYLWLFAGQHGVEGGWPGVKLLKELAEDCPALLPDLAAALIDLGILYRGVGRAQEALLAAEEAVARWRPLAEADPSRLPTLALALSNLGVVYREAGHVREAVPITEEAVRRYRPLAEANPAQLAGLAMAVINLAACYWEVGCLDEAVPAAEEAVRLCRPLAKDNLAHQVKLATAVNNLGLIYRTAGRVPEAIPVAEEAVALCRPLASADPSHLPALAMATLNLATCYLAVARLTEAVPVAEEAVQRYRPLAETNPAFLPTLATAVNNLGLIYREAGRVAEALPAAEEAVQRYRALAPHNPAHLPGLAMAIMNLATCHLTLGRLAEALPVAEEAVARYRTLAETNPAHLPDLATALNNLGLVFREAGWLAEAIAAGEEAVERCRPLAAAHDARLPGLAMALCNLAAGYLCASRFEEAVCVAEEAVARQRPLAAANPAHRPGLAMALNNLGLVYRGLGRPSDAVSVAEEAVTMVREMAQGSPAQLPDLAMAVLNLSSAYREAGRLADALPLAEEAAARYQSLAESGPARLGDLATALSNLTLLRTRADPTHDRESLWETAAAPLPIDFRVELLLQRALRDELPAESVQHFCQAAHLIQHHDLPFAARLHAMARSTRARRPVEFDAAWCATAGVLPDWLALSPGTPDLESSASPATGPLVEPPNPERKPDEP